MKHAYAHVTTPDSEIDVDMPIQAARKLEAAGRLKYDGKVEQSETVEHLFTPINGCTAEELVAAGAN